MSRIYLSKREHINNKIRSLGFSVEKERDYRKKWNSVLISLKGGEFITRDIILGLKNVGVDFTHSNIMNRIRDSIERGFLEKKGVGKGMKYKLIKDPT